MVGQEEVRINGDFSFNAGVNSVSMPTDRGTTGYLLATNASTGQAYWTAQVTGESTTAANGLFESGNQVRMGGSLIQTTTIDLSSYNLSFNLNSTGEFDVQDGATSVLFVQNDGKVGIRNNSPTYTRPNDLQR